MVRDIRTCTGKADRAGMRASEAPGRTARRKEGGVEEIAAHLVGLEGVDFVYLLLEPLLEECFVFGVPLFVCRPLL